MALTKHDIAEQIQVGLGFPKIQSVEISETLLELIKASLASSDDVLLMFPKSMLPKISTFPPLRKSLPLLGMEKKSTDLFDSAGWPFARFRRPLGDMGQQGK